MPFDETRVVIRERGWLEILDLSLGMLRTRALPILAALAAGAVPLALFNSWLLNDLLKVELLDDEREVNAGYFVWLLLLMLTEIPLATAPLTIYLGQLLFVDKPRPGLITANLWRSLPQLILFQVLLRGVLIVMILTWIFPFAVWPFLNEIILLERNPLVARRENEVSMRRRSAALHAGTTGEMFSRGVGSAMIALALTIALTLSLDFGRTVLGGHGAVDWWLLAVELPLAMWLIVGFFTVVRFLSYLDLRIRREGWEVELSLRAEAARLARQLV
jgi:hypothetical protein